MILQTGGRALGETLQGQALLFYPTTPIFWAHHTELLPSSSITMT